MTLVHPSGKPAGLLPPKVVSYPKSGRSWLRYMFQLCGHGLEVTHAGMGSYGKDLFRQYRGVDTSRLRDRRPIILHRNPIDTAVSLFFQVTLKDRDRTLRRHPIAYGIAALQGRLPPTTIEEFMVHPRLGVENVCRFNRDWITWADSCPGCIVLSYEELRTDPVGRLGALLDALGLQPRQPIEAVVEQAAFESMQRKERDGELKGALWGRTRPDDPESGKVRRGVVRGYHQYLGDELIESLRTVARRHGFDA
ncbi:MAG: hypothetical protein RL461_1029 [Planctomycetota bacterium]